jgi:3-oxoacyl-[acyl-carrier protein] reductase
MTNEPQGQPAGAAGATARPVCIVTGASGSIGAAIALWFARHGHDLAIHYSHRAEAAEEIASRCRAAGAQARVLRADIAQDADCRALAEEVHRHWGAADVLVNNAGVSPRFADLKDLDALSADDFLAACRVNVAGTFQMSRAFATLLRRGQGGGAIVNVSSMASVMGTGSSMAYAASKGGLNTLTLALARALAPDVRVNAVLPGMVDGDWMRRGLGEAKFAAARQRYETRSLLRRVLEPDDVARAVHWLACGALRQTGQLMELDAGFRLG